MGLLGSDTFWKNCEVSTRLQWCEFERTCVSLQPHSEEMDLTQRFRKHRVSKRLVLHLQKGMLFPISEAWCSRLHLTPLGCEPSLTPCLGYPGALLRCTPPLDSRHGSPVGIALYMHEYVSPMDCEPLSGKQEPFLIQWLLIMADNKWSVILFFFFLFTRQGTRRWVQCGKLSGILFGSISLAFLKLDRHIPQALLGEMR